MKIALFDFCDTLVNFQTADVFVDYTLEKYKKQKTYKKILKIKCIKNFLASHWKLRKMFHLFQMKGLSETEIDEAAKDFFWQYIYPNRFPYMEKMIEEYKGRGYKTYIVSGGYHAYIKYYAETHGMDGVLANTFMYKKRNGQKIFIGYIEGKDCMEEEKILRINSLFSKERIEESIAFSDSLSDLPMLKWAKRGILVSKYKERKCAAEYNLDQIVLSMVELSGTPFEFSNGR